MSESNTELTSNPASHRVSTREPRNLSTEYHKAHKQSLLWAAILLFWELVGVDLNQAKQADGNIGALLKSIGSTQAVPWVFLILVGYFLFKLTVEWVQCNQARKRLIAS